MISASVLGQTDRVINNLVQRLLVQGDELAEPRNSPGSEIGHGAGKCGQKKETGGRSDVPHLTSRSIYPDVSKNVQSCPVYFERLSIREAK